MTPKTKNGPERLHPLEALNPTNSHEGTSSTMSLPTRRRPRPPLADWDAADLILQADAEGRPASELLAEILADDKAAELAAERATSAGEIVTSLLLALGAIVASYIFIVGIFATAARWS